MYRQYSLMLHNLECLHVGYNVTQVRCNINISYCEVVILNYLHWISFRLHSVG